MTGVSVHAHQPQPSPPAAVFLSGIFSYTQRDLTLNSNPPTLKHEQHGPVLQQTNTAWTQLTLSHTHTRYINAYIHHLAQLTHRLTRTEQKAFNCLFEQAVFTRLIIYSSRSAVREKRTATGKRCVCSPEEHL